MPQIKEDQVYFVNMLKRGIFHPFRPWTITIIILAATPLHNKVLVFINAWCSNVICHFKCSSVSKLGGFWLAVNVFMVHQLEKNSLKVIPTNYSSVLLSLKLWCVVFPSSHRIRMIIKIVYSDYRYCYRPWCEWAFTVSYFFSAWKF